MSEGDYLPSERRASSQREALIMSVYVSKRNESKVQFLETARKLSAHTLTYCLKAPKRLTFFLTKDICALARKVYYEANQANLIIPRNKIEAQNRRMHFMRGIRCM